MTKTWTQRIRNMAREHGPAAAEYYAWKTAEFIHKGLLPNIDFYNHQTAWGYA